MSTMPQYEFTERENELIGSLSSKMRFVGVVTIALGVINLLMALLVVGAIYRDRLPGEWKTRTTEYLEKARAQLPEETRKQAEEYSLDKLPPNNHLWGIAFNTGVIGLFYLLLGSWTRSAGVSFQKIVDTRGNDISNLMNGLSSLHSMYTLLYALVVVTILFGLIAMAVTIYQSLMVR